MNIKIKACFSVFTLFWAGLGLHHCSRDNSTIMNPIVEGFYADPSIVEYGDSYYIYATIDPWGNDELAVLVSKDFRHWEQKELNWPTKEACTSPTSSSNMVWAPSVIRSSDGMFYMYVSGAVKYGLESAIILWGPGKTLVPTQPNPSQPVRRS